MALVLLVILLPLVGAALIAVSHAGLGRSLACWASLPAAASFLISLRFLPAESQGETYLWTVDWFPVLGVRLSLGPEPRRLDPVGAHMIARAAYRSQVPLHDRTIVSERAIEEEVSELREGR